MKKICLVIMCGLLGLCQASAQSSAICEGNKLYKEGRYDDALAAYDKAEKKSGRFNRHVQPLKYPGKKGR